MRQHWISYVVFALGLTALATARAADGGDHDALPAKADVRETSQGCDHAVRACDHGHERVTGFNGAPPRPGPPMVR